MMSHPHYTGTPKSEGDWFEALAALARYLRSPEGCPWDREQTYREFAKFSREETDELVEAVEKDDGEHMAEEFGDVFFCLLATAAAAEEAGKFTLEDALARIHEKMIRRHDHVFGEKKAQTPEEAVEAWNKVKRDEKNNP